MNPYDDDPQDTPLEDTRAKIQALVDNELPDSEIEPVLETIQGSYEYRAEYAELLRLRRRLAAGPAPPVSADWLAKAERRISRRVTQSVGAVLLVGSYAVLLGYALFTFLRDPEVPRLVTVLVALGALGIGALLVNAVADRIREKKTDRYREIIR